MTIEELKQAYDPEGVYAGMTQAEALRYLAKRYLRKPECVALCNEVANNLPKLLKVVEEMRALQARCDKLEAAARRMLEWDADPIRDALFDGRGHPSRGRWGEDFEALRSVVDGGE